MRKPMVADGQIAAAAAAAPTAAIGRGSPGFKSLAVRACFLLPAGVLVGGGGMSHKNIPSN